MQRKYGYFTFAEDMIFRVDISMVFAKMEFVPTKVEFNYGTMMFEYLGISKLFRNVGVGETIPWYVIIINFDADKMIIDIEAEELKVDEIPQAYKITVENTEEEHGDNIKEISS